MCCEAGRWGLSLQTSLQRGRAPISVVAAIRSVRQNSTADDFRTRQRNVWNSIKRHEERNGERPTSSLVQIMSEDSKTKSFEARTTQLRRIVTRIGETNGVLVALNGEPLLLEFFSDAEAFPKFHDALIETLPFDIFNDSEIEISDRAIHEFIDMSLADSLKIRSRSQRGVHFQRFTGGLSIRAFGLSESTKDLMHLMAINLEHPTLENA